MLKALVQSLASHKLGVVVHICHPRTQEVGAEGAEIQGHLWLPSEFEASWGLSWRGEGGG